MFSLGCGHYLQGTKQTLEVDTWKSQLEGIWVLGWYNIILQNVGSIKPSQHEAPSHYSIFNLA